MTTKLRSTGCLFALLLSFLWLTGCASSYTTPSGRADLTDITSSTMRESFAAKPAAVLPANIAAVRVQTTGYSSYRTRDQGGVYGGGRYSVLTVREVEDEADLKRITELPNVAGLTGVGRLLLPEELNTDVQLREGAARVKADMLLIYTFETTFRQNDESTALKIISLGWSPTRKVSVYVTVSALLMDVRTGFIYGTLEATEKRALQTTAWDSEEAMDRARQEAETAGFKALVREFEKAWPSFANRAKQGA
jgi:hypothetical protein